jgi:hypothetical protein
MTEVDLKKEIAASDAKEKNKQLDCCPACNGSGGERWFEPDGSENGEACWLCMGSGARPSKRYLEEMAVHNNSIWERMQTAESKLKHAEKCVLFVNHIDNHLSTMRPDGSVKDVMCKICYMTIDQIYDKSKGLK